MGRFLRYGWYDFGDKFASCRISENTHISAIYHPFSKWVEQFLLTISVSYFYLHLVSPILSISEEKKRWADRVERAKEARRRNGQNGWMGGKSLITLYIFSTHHHPFRAFMDGRHIIPRV